MKYVQLESILLIAKEHQIEQKRWWMGGVHNGGENEVG